MQTILNGCYSGANPVACNFIHRDALGTVKTANDGFVISAEGNIAGDKVQGFDAELNYDVDLNDWGWEKAGSLSFNAVGTLVTVNNTDFPGTPTLHCAGTWGPNCGEPQNRWRHNFRVTWTDNKGDFSLSLRWRHLSAVQLELYQDGSGFTDLNPATGRVGPHQSIPDFDYFDLSGTWAVADSIDLRAGVRNLFDQDPQVVDNNSAPSADVNSNVFPNTYDVLGRIIFVGASVKL